MSDANRDTMRWRDYTPDVAGPTTAAGMAAAKGWRSSIVPALLVGTFGYAIATFISIALGFNALKPMA